MLQAILHGKAGRFSDDSGQKFRWRSVFKRNEDLLTAVFFGRFPYLSPAGQSALLSFMIGRNVDPDVSGEFLDIFFWEKLSRNGSSYVEPDIIIVWEKLVVVGEIKPPFGGWQYKQQWEKEIEGLLSSQEELNIDPAQLHGIHLVALGKNAPSWRNDARAVGERFKDDSVQVNAVEWSDLRYFLDENEIASTSADQFIVDDWKEALGFFGIHPKLTDFSEIMPKLSSLDSDWALGLVKELSLPSRS